MKKTVKLDHISERWANVFHRWAAITYKPKRAILPHRCWLSGRWIWPGEVAYMGYKRLAPLGTPNPPTEARWVKGEEYLIRKLQGTL